MIGAIGQGSGFAKLMSALQAPDQLQRADKPRHSHARETAVEPKSHSERPHRSARGLRGHHAHEASAHHKGSAHRPGSFHRLSRSEFAELKAQSLEQRSRSELSFELTTLEGDRITLQFEQMDFHRVAQAGQNLEATASMERAVSMSVQGDLSAEELAAVESAIQSASDIASRFFSGDLAEPASVMAALDFDGQQLSSLSLEMKQSQSSELTRLFSPAREGVKGLMSRNSDIAHLINDLGTAQRKMIDQLGEFLEAPSAAKLTRGLVPALIS